ncbi:MAG: extracellular solute-binding protein [Lachnospiraceae bacterium]|nr:extracellular solute-binding protein [Lachnospiraceae bacterium]MBO5144243.1 extracellular solute-binding protein [Lachnospiraceae bacterium]
MKKIDALLFITVFTISLTGCGKNTGEKLTPDTLSANNTDSGTVNLRLWGAAEDEALLSQIIDSFVAEYQGQAEFNITFEAQGESTCKDVLMTDLEGGADVFTFADDQLNTLVASGALEPVKNADAIKAENLAGAVEAASIGDTLYAYPLTADNGYFLYYNKKYLTSQDVEALDRILETAAENGKKVTMDWSSAWYVYSFFGNTGLEVGLNNDGITNYCTWNSTDGDITGVDVAQAMLDIAKNPGFSNTDDSGFLSGVQDGSVIAGISGVWNSVAVEEAWGEDYGAVKLPTYTCAGEQVQMASFSGYKLIGVNAYSGNYEWACKLAEWISNEQNQRLRFALRGQGPSNINASASAEVQESLAISALIEQSDYARLQRVGDTFWDPVAEFAKNMAAGNAAGDSLQDQLDKMAEKVTKQ